MIVKSEKQVLQIKTFTKYMSILIKKRNSIHATNDLNNFMATRNCKFTLGKAIIAIVRYVI